jgi:dynein heavy chain
MKDLANIIGIQCVIFNCSQDMNIHSIAKLFKGLISSGAWSCFDEFNKIKTNVLSVVSSFI